MKVPEHLRRGRLNIGLIVFSAITVSAVVAGTLLWLRQAEDRRSLEAQQEHLSELIVNETIPPTPQQEQADTASASMEVLPSPAQTGCEILPAYRAMFEENPDMIGWLSIDGTVIDYPVMQTPEDEDYYLDKGFDKQPNSNGCLILGAACSAGIGTREQGYEDGSAPSTNLIIHGHTMQSGMMFGNLPLYEDHDYASEHSTICFDSLYEHREYEIIAAFYSQVYYKDQDIFKYYQFVQADTQEDFDNWYDNIKALSLYDTGVTAAFGDEFITLSCCSYQVEDGRFVVVGKRIA
mgnify:CR=1 FL=1